METNNSFKDGYGDEPNNISAMLDEDKILLKKKKKRIMGKIKLVAALLAFAAAVYIILVYFGSGFWPKRFSKELDRFFGEDNWEVTDADYDRSRFLKKRVNRDSGSRKSNGYYNKWYIEYENPYTGTDVCGISNLSHRINHRKYFIFSPKRRSNRTSFYIEMLEIAEYIACDDFQVNMVEKIMPQNQADCIWAVLDKLEGYPDRSEYYKLWEQDWFNVDDLSMKHFLDYDGIKYGLIIRCKEYQFGKLSEEEKEEFFQNLDRLSEAIKNEYGEEVSFEIITSNVQKLYGEE